MRRHQHGAALLTALILVTLIATLAAALVARQQRAIALEGADRQRAQAEWVLLGALDWARLILREDLRANQAAPKDDLGEVWAVPLAEARLSSFLSGPDGAAPDDGPEAFLAGRIEDAQARYNLTNLGGQKVDPLEAETFRRLCLSAGLPSDLADSLLVQLNKAIEAQDDTADAPVRPRTVSQLAWLGAPPAALQALEPWVVILPKRTPVNVNTAPREVLAALVKGLDLATAERIVQQRRLQPLRGREDIFRAFDRATSDPQLTGERIGVESSFFWVTGQLRLDGRSVTLRSLVERKEGAVDAVWRERLPPAAAQAPR